MGGLEGEEDVGRGKAVERCEVLHLIPTYQNWSNSSFDHSSDVGDFSFLRYIVRKRSRLPVITKLELDPVFTEYRN